MGGSRCSFRQCHVRTSRYPRMHFFRFPLKESERLKKWMQYSQLEQFVHYTETRKKNTVVCCRHFRVECFMNYKMEKLVPNAIPTLIMLSKNQALDFELDVEKGVLVTLEQTKLKHLIPPENFESPLYLENDKILMELLHQVQQQPKTPPIVEENVEYLETCDEDEQFLLKDTMKSSSNTVEILETIQFFAPFKRNRECSINEIEPRVADSIKKFKILNSTHSSMVKENKNETTVILTSRPDQNDSNNVIIGENIEFVECNNVQNQRADSFTNESSEGNDEDLEFFEIQKIDNESLHGSETLDSDSTIVQLKTDTQTSADSIKQQLVTAQYENLNLKKQNEEIEHLQMKICLLENENSLLKATCKEVNELRKKLLQLEMKNYQMEKILKEQKVFKEKIAKYRKENIKLKEENDGIAVLKADLLSRLQEIEKLKEMVESFKSTKSNDSELRLKNTNESKLKEELTSLQNQAEVKQKELSIAKSQLLKIEADFNTIKHERDSLQQKHFDLKLKYWKLQALQSKEATISTSVENSTIKTTATASTTSLTKAQLFNGVKRYLSSAMVSLLRMEMFGNSEREWKTDEREIAVDLLRLGETVYNYFIDEWRFRLPALREVRNWLSQSAQMCDEKDP